MACDAVRRTLSDGDRRVLRGRRLRAHLRDCAGCAAFATAIPDRRRDLQALAPPMAPIAAAGVLERVVQAGHGHGAIATGARVAVGQAGGSAGFTAGKSAGAALATKALVGVAIVATATIGVTVGLIGSKRPHSHSGSPTLTRFSGVPGAARKGAMSVGGVDTVGGASGTAAGVGTSLKGASGAAAHGKHEVPGRNAASTAAGGAGGAPLAPGHASTAPQTAAAKHAQAHGTHGQPAGRHTGSHAGGNGRGQAITTGKPGSSQGNGSGANSSGGSHGSTHGGSGAAAPTAPASRAPRQSVITKTSQTATSGP